MKANNCIEENQIIFPWVIVKRPTKNWFYIKYKHKKGLFLRKSPRCKTHFDGIKIVQKLHSELLISDFNAMELIEKILSIKIASLPKNLYSNDSFNFFFDVVNKFVESIRDEIQIKCITYHIESIGETPTFKLWDDNQSKVGNFYYTKDFFYYMSENFSRSEKAYEWIENNYKLGLFGPISRDRLIFQVEQARLIDIQYDYCLN